MRRSCQGESASTGPGLALFDSQTPERCILRGDTWVFGRAEVYERQGAVAIIVFPCGYTLGPPNGDTLNLYYGAADTCVAMATSSVGALLDWLQCHGRSECEPSGVW